MTATKDILELHKKKLIDEQNEKVEELLKNKKILNLYLSEFKKKIVGEEKNILAIFISCCSIFVSNQDIQPHTFLTGESSAGKSFVMKKVYDIFPIDRKIHRTKITPEVFTYWHNAKFEPDWTWDGKILYVEDPKNSFINSDTFKIMMSEGSISTVVIKQIAIDIEIKGKPLILLTTAHTNPKREIINRFNILPMDETPLQTHSILLHTASNQNKSEDYEKTFTYALSRLSRVVVTIPYATELVTAFPIKNIRVRRDFMRFLTLIKCSAALHQNQREFVEGKGVVASIEDYHIVKEIFGHIMKNDCMSALTHKLQKAYETCQRLTKNKADLREDIDSNGALSVFEKCELKKAVWGFRVKEAHVMNPSLSSERGWYDLVDSLAQEGLLEAKLEETSDRKKPATLYRILPTCQFTLPKLDQEVLLVNE